MVPIAGVLLLQVPPGVALVRELHVPAHTLSEPLIAAGNGLTVTIAVLIQPVLIVYDITAVPPATPVTTPLDEPTVAIPILPLVHVPPDGELDNVAEDPWQSK
jgi:hypothetical protein